MLRAATQNTDKTQVGKTIRTKTTRISLLDYLKHN